MKKTIFLLIFFFPPFVFAEDYPELAKLPQSIHEIGLDHGVRWEAYVLGKNETPRSLFKNLSEDAMSFNRLSRRFWKEDIMIRMPEDISQIRNWTPMPENYKRCGKRQRCIVISLRDQFLGLYKKGVLKKSYPISTGMNEMKCGRPEGSRNCKTPVGDFSVKGRILKAFSYLYRVWMWYALNIRYGRYIHAGNLPGSAASHGCIRMFKRDARIIFNTARVKTKVFIVKDL